MPVADNRHYVEELYLKKTGEFFIYGKGNALSKYAFDNPAGGREPGEEILPVSFDRAKEWYTARLNDQVPNFTDEQYKELFAIADSDEKVKMTISISGRSRKALQDLAMIQNKSQSQIIESLILAEADEEE